MNPEAPHTRPATGPEGPGQGTRRFDVLRRLGDRPATRDYGLYGAAILVGIAGCLGAIAFRLIIWGLQSVFYGGGLNPGSVAREPLPFPDLFGLSDFLGPWRLVLIPALGGLLVGLLIHATSPEVRGHGVPKVLRSLLLGGGRISPKIAAYKTAASGLAIASGASLGREGPIVQIGSAIGSTIGGAFRRTTERRILVAAGAAAGIGATFNAPLGGIVFALEILLANISLRSVITIVLASATGTVLAQTILGLSPTAGLDEFLVPIHYTLQRPLVELPLYALLGVLLGFLMAGSVRLLYGLEGRFERLRIPGPLKPALGGALLGLLAIATAAVYGVRSEQGATWLFGVGYGVVHDAIAGDLALGLLIGLAVAKLLAFSLSIGSGSSGGVFSPSLYVGAMAGGAFGMVAGHGVEGIAGAGAYAIVGMGGAFAAAASAPLTASIILFEMTGEYTILAPMLVVTVIGSDLTRRLLKGDNVYTTKMRMDGLTIQMRRAGNLEDVEVREVMRTDVVAGRAGEPFAEAARLLLEHNMRAMPVVDEQRRPIAVVTARGLALRGVRDTDLPTRADLESGRIEWTGAVRRPFGIGPEANLLMAVDQMLNRDVRMLLVVEQGVLVGVITQSDVLKAFEALRT